MGELIDDVLTRIAADATRLDRTGVWPGDALADLARAGALAWSIPQVFGGQGMPPLELHLQYERLATASVAVALVFTQRDAAVGLLAGSDGCAARAGLLREALSADHWMTVGIAQLTTSRQGSSPALRAERVDGGYRLNGLIPWCTGGAQARAVIAGAVVDGGAQILFRLDPQQTGVNCEAMELVALRATHTGAIRLSDVMVDDRAVLRGPADGVLGGGRHTSLTLGQSFIAFGLCRAALQLMAEHRSATAKSAHEKLQRQLQEVRDEVIALSRPGREADAAAANARIRGTCNELAVRITHAAVALYKGTALLLDHPAQRLAREALFLLVWSCPNPVIDCTVELLAAEHPTTNLHE